MEEALRRIRRWKKQKKPRKWLNLSGLGLTELPLIPSKVRRLLCVRNQLKTFDNLPKRLQELACGGNTFETAGLKCSLVYKTNYNSCAVFILLYSFSKVT